VPRDALAALVRAARSLRDALSSWPEEEGIAALCAWLRRLLVSALGWEGDEPAQAPLLQALDQLAEELPDEVEIDRAEFLLLLREAFAALGSRPIGGAGAGVPVLDAIQARARTFEHLFVLGLNRDVFPRVVLEDPLLPDALRAALVDQGRGVVPDLPLKLGGFDEERYLFAQLLSASPQVTLSWQAMDDDGKERAASTLVERIRLAAPATSIEKLPTLWSPVASTAERPADEHATLAALHGSRAAVARILPLALGDAIAAGAAAPGFSAAAAAAARMAALEMLEPRGDARDTLGAAFGFVGERRARDERDGPLAITTLERIAVCPWQAFLGRVLHLEPAPDALEALPAIDALLLGTVLHATIEEIVKSAIPGESGSLEAALSRGSVPVPWPGEEAVRRILGRVAAQALCEEGLGFAGLAQVAAERVLPLVRAVFQHVWLPASGTPTLFGAELTGTLRVRDDDARLREIRFRADLAEAVGPLVRLIDLKSGKPISLHKREATRQAKLLEAVASGKRLQTTAYACAVEGEGRYLFADPERSGEQPVASVMHDTPDVIEAFDAAVRTLLATWDRGSFLPRLELPEGVAGDPPCGHCQVSEACVPGDSGARMRLRRWAALGEPAQGAGAAALRSARAVFQLPARKSDPGPAGGEDA
jgi:hypothetical protein